MHSKILNWVQWESHVFKCFQAFLLKFENTYIISYSKMWRRKWKTTPVFLAEKSHGPRSLVGYSPWGHKKLATAEWLSTHSKLPITFPGHLHLKILWKANTELFWVWTQKLKASLFLILGFLEHLQGSTASLQIEWVNLLPSRLFVSMELTHSSSKAPFPSKPRKQRSSCTERELIMYLSYGTQNKSFDTMEQTVSCKLARSSRVLQYDVSHMPLKRQGGWMAGWNILIFNLHKYSPQPQKHSKGSIVRRQYNT